MQNKHHLKLLRLKEVWPWWGDLPDVNLSTCITPDLLHQAYQGLFRMHLVRWMKAIIRVDRLNDWFAAMPPAEGLSRYPNGISAISSNRWTGSESKKLLVQFLPTVVGPLDADMREMVRALVDFIYQAHAPSLTESNLDAMDDDLHIFHQRKSLLVGLVYNKADHFNKIAKLHMLRHWTHAIRELGTLDRYNTEALEHLHIEYAKVPWQSLNKVKPLPQMVTYIQWQEVIHVHQVYLERYLAGEAEDSIDDANENSLVDIIDYELHGDLESLAETGNEGSVRQSTVNSLGEIEDKQNIVPEPVYYPNPMQRMAKTLTVKKLLIQDLIDRYVALDIISATTNFLT
jgi:hypothetical protein